MIRLIVCIIVLSVLVLSTLFVSPAHWYVIGGYITLLMIAITAILSYVLGYRMSCYIGLSVGFLLFLLWQGIFGFEFVGLFFLVLGACEVMYRIGVRMIQ